MQEKKVSFKSSRNLIVIMNVLASILFFLSYFFLKNIWLLYFVNIVMFLIGNWARLQNLWYVFFEKSKDQDIGNKAISKRMTHCLLTKYGLEP